jgi:Ser/Thr protein kinase RdoA (MazF antagonist)
MEEMRLLLFLNRKNFPYQVPMPLKNKKGEFISKWKKTHFWIYKKIGGKSIKKISSRERKEIARALATFHLFTRRFRPKNKIFRYHKFSKSRSLDPLYQKLAKEKYRAPYKKYLLGNLSFMREILGKAQALEYKKGKTVIHSDLNMKNVLFKDGKIFSIIDFENINIGTVSEDLAYSIKMTCFNNRKLNFSSVEEFLKEYSKINKLPKDIFKEIIVKMIIDNCIYLYRAHISKKPLKEKDFLIRWTIETTKDISRFI